MKKILEYILDLLLPQSEKVRKIENMNPAEFRKAAGLRPAASDSAPGTLVIFNYQRPVVRDAIWELKYRGNRKIAKLLATMLYEEIAQELSDQADPSKPMLIPIPLSKERFRERGFNQCELLSEELERLDSGNFFESGRDILIKARHTQSQTKKNRAARLRDLKNCFTVKNPEKIADKRVILLDDVTTTGATLEEACRTLREAGAKKILKVALAH